MMKRSILIFLAGLLSVSLLAGCGASGTEATTAAGTETQGETAEESKEAEESASEAEGETETAEDEPEDAGGEEETEAAGEAAVIRVGSLKGPTSMGLVFLMELAENGKTDSAYEFTMVTAADELLPKVIGGDVDIALVPANVASILYNRTGGQVAVIDINTLGVLYGVTADESIRSLEDLRGRTVYMTGKGTTPDYVFQYLLNASGLADKVTLEFKSEPAEVAALLAAQPESVGILPQPFVTAACAQNESLKTALDLTKEWDALQAEDKGKLVTGVTLVRKEFLEQHPEQVSEFLREHEKSAGYTRDQAGHAAELVAKAGIIEKAPVAEKALPYCNITCITGQEMKAALSGYLNVLFSQDEASVGGALPRDDFYWEEPNQ